MEDKMKTENVKMTTDETAADECAGCPVTSTDGCGYCRFVGPCGGKCLDGYYKGCGFCDLNA